MSWNFSLDDDFKKANSVNLASVFNFYNLQIQPNFNSKCPFHKDNTPSFRFYENNNTFYCFSCKVSGGPVKFIEQYTNINNYEAIQLLLGGFESNSLFINERSNNYDKVYLEFSHLVRGFILKNKDNASAVSYAEYVCSAFDNVRNKYTLDPDGLNVVFVKLKRKLENFK